MKNNHKSWYVITNRVEARIFQQQGVAQELTLMHRFSNPEGDLRTSELVSDYRGRADTDSHSGHIALGSEDTPRAKVLERFIHKLSQSLELDAYHDSFQSLILVAEPHVLGELKKQLGTNSVARLVRLIPKDLVNVSDYEVVNALADLLTKYEPILENSGSLKNNSG